MSGQKKIIMAYYDIGSPFSYVAMTILKKYLSSAWASKVQISLHPVLLGGIFKATGNQPPASLPAKTSYMKNDMTRLGQWAGIPLKVPNDFPISSLKAMRILTAVKMNQPENLWKVSMALFKGYWEDSVNIADTQALKTALENYANYTSSEASTLIKSSESTETKKKLIQDTNESVKQGLFGCPAFVIKSSDVSESKVIGLADPLNESGYEMFFGADRIPLLAYYLDLPYFGPLAEKHIFDSELSKI